jgi:translocation and assembly module TamB
MDTPETAPENVRPARWFAAVLRLVRTIVPGVLALVAIGLVVLDSPLGHRLVTDRIAALKLQSGLVITIGRIDGSLFGKGQLHDVVLSDPRGRFMTVPAADLDWRPMPALWLALGMGGGLDIRNLALHRGLLLRAPHLNQADPDAPILPDFDIRIDRLAVDGLTVAPGLAGARRRIDLTARARVAGGRVVVDCRGRLGGRDKLALHLDSEPDRDIFALNLDYRAPQGGLLAGLTGMHRTVLAQIGGTGRFSDWHGWLVAQADTRRVAGGLITMRAGHVGMSMLLHPDVAFDAGGTTLAQLAGNRAGLTFAGTFADGRIDGHTHLANAMGTIDATGLIDLTHNRADGLGLTVRLARPELLPAAWRVVVRPGTATLTAQIDGPFGDLAIRHSLALTGLEASGVHFDGLHTAGVARWHGGLLYVPIMADAARIATGTPWLDQRLAHARATGTLRLAGTALSGDNLRIAGSGLGANLALKVDLWRGALALAGRVDARGVVVPQLGTVDAVAKGVIATGQRVPWTIAVNYAGSVSRFANSGVTAFAGPRTRVSGSLHWGAARPLQMPAMAIVSDRLRMTAALAYAQDGRLTLSGEGHHADYGLFDATATIDRLGTQAAAHFADPLPAAGVHALALTLASTPGGYRIDAGAQSRLGPLAARIDLAVPPYIGASTGAGAHDPVRMTLSQARLFDTQLTGTFTLGAYGVDGDLLLAGGGLDGVVHFAGRADGQAIDGAVMAHDARFGSDRRIAIAQARLTAKALFSNANSTVESTLQAQGVAVGGLFIGRLLADATMVNGSGSVTASMAGRRGTRLALQGTAAFTPTRVIAFVAGDYAGNTITMPRRAIFNRTDAGWQMEPGQINFGSGAVIANGSFGAGSGADTATRLHLEVSRMPLSALDIVYPDLGLGGYASGVIDYRNDHSGAPEGHAALTVLGMTRSGLVLTSRPLDLALTAALDARALQVRAIAREGTAPRMRLQALVTDLPRGGTMVERLRGGALRAHLRYAGPADALWRLAAIDAFDLTGPVGVAADVAGTIDAPLLTGAVVSHDLRAQSAISGSDIRAIDLVGSFNAAQLSLAHFTGTTPGGGRIAGSGSIDFSDATTERPKLDLRLGATNAELLNRPEMGATITGPIRIVSDGHGGTVAGRLRIDRARWVLGRTTAGQSLPSIAVTERNAAADVAPPPPRGLPWKLLIDASGANRIDVRGLGLESEWQADVRLRGDTTTPQIFGSADVIRGSYEFAGKRFDLSRGRIRFNGEVPIDPQLDIVATGDANDISATISIGGSAARPQITFASTPSLPEEELLSRILFGSSIAQISAPEAVQLASALAALRGGGGLDPINKLRGAIGLDRLRVLSADPSIGRGTALAVGKYLGRRFFVELVTDGHGYSASSIEFRLTRWLSLLGTISTVYDDSVSLKYTRDY